MAPDQTHFMNVDLELAASIEIAPLLEHWSDTVVVLRNTADEGRRSVWLELEVEHREVEHVLLGFVDLVGRLPEELRQLWNACDDRCFNVGVQAGSSPPAATYSVSPRTLGRIAAVMARVAITVYALPSGGDT